MYVYGMLYAACPPPPAPTPNLIRLSVTVETNAILLTDVGHAWRILSASTLESYSFQD